MATEVTLQEIILAVRELTFDRFIIPAFALKAKAGYAVSIDAETGLTITNNTEGSTEQPIVFSFTDYPTLEELMNALIAAGIVVAYTPYFKGTEPSTTLIKVTDRAMDSDIKVFRRYFFSDAEITAGIEWYYARVLDIVNQPITDELTALLVRPSEKHMSLWVSYHLVDKRRLYENAAQAIGQSFTDGSDYEGSAAASMGAGTTTSVQIGSVFSITEDPKQGFFYEDFDRVGSDNVWGDRYSFWYKLMLYLRGLLEETFGDYSLRKNNVIPGNIELQRELDFRSYYDSYPFTLSPLSRGILSRT